MAPNEAVVSIGIEVRIGEAVGSDIDNAVIEARVIGFVKTGAISLVKRIVPVRSAAPANCRSRSSS